MRKARIRHDGRGRVYSAGLQPHQHRHAILDAEPCDRLAHQSRVVGMAHNPQDWLRVLGSERDGHLAFTLHAGESSSELFLAIPTRSFVNTAF